MKQQERFHKFSSVRAATGLAAVLLTVGYLQAQKKTTPAPAAPAKAAPAAKAATPAATHTATAGAHTTTTTTSHTTTTAHGPTTAGGHTTTTTSRTITTTGAHPGPAASHPSPTNVSAHGAAIGGHPAPRGAQDLHGPKGDVRMRPGGHPADVHRPGMDIHHNLGGGRRVGFDRPGGGRGYYERGRPGYIGHPYRAHGYEFNRRSYYYHGRAYDRYYRPYGYHGYALDVYAPGRYYGVGFYGWAYNPWVTPVPYAWGFAAAPWYGAYGAYFTPYPVYAAPSLWLTDYLISATLAASFEAQREANASAVAAAYAGPPLAPDVKDLVAAEVKREIALENAEAAQNAQQQAPDPASSGIARLMSDGQPHVFVAGKEVDVTDGATGQECAITDGDVVQVTTPPGPADTTANVVVLASKGGKDCPRTATVAIGLDELQDMNNHMRETLDAGLAELQTKQGKGGLPAAPPSAAAPPVMALVAQDAPPPDPSVAKELDEQAKASETAEQEVLATTPGAAATATASVAAPAAPPTPAPDVSIAPGQSLDDVKGSLGEPTKVVKLGTKTMYFYKDMKVTFVNGKVTNIE